MSDDYDEPRMFPIGSRVDAIGRKMPYQDGEVMAYGPAGGHVIQWPGYPVPTLVADFLLVPHDPEHPDYQKYTDQDLRALAQVISNSFFAMQAGGPPTPSERQEPNAGEMQLAEDILKAGYSR